jgi:hypothetical protein
MDYQIKEKPLKKPAGVKSIQKASMNDNYMPMSRSGKCKKKHPHIIYKNNANNISKGKKISL